MRNKKAGLIARAIAFLLDAILLGAVMRVFADVHPFFSILASIIYFVLLDSSKAQGTLGKQIVGLKIVNKDGERMSLPLALSRHLLKIVSTLFFGIGYLIGLIGKKDERAPFPDLVTGTSVVYKG